MPTSCAEKVREAGERLTAGAVPVPASAMVSGLPGALSIIVTVPLRVPEAVGVNVTQMVQVTPALRQTQLLVWEKSPLAVMLLMLRMALPLLLRMTL